MNGLAGKFYWPSDEYSIPADNLCWHVPPSPNADFRCIRPEGHPGKHQHEWSPKIKDHSHKSQGSDTTSAAAAGNPVSAARSDSRSDPEASSATSRERPMGELADRGEVPQTEAVGVTGGESAAPFDYEDYDDHDDEECGQCGGGGYVFDCFDGCCLHAEEGCDLCTVRCDWCNNPTPKQAEERARLGQILADAVAKQKP